MKAKLMSWSKTVIVVCCAALLASPRAEACDENSLKVETISFAREIKKGKPVKPRDDFVANGRRIYIHFVIWAPVTGLLRVELYQKGKRFRRYTLRIKKGSPRFRTWVSFRALRKRIGDIRVVVKDKRRHVIAKERVEVYDPNEDPSPWGDPEEGER